MNLWNRDELRRLLTELGQLLDRQGITGELYVVGGAAIALAYDGRRATRDVDAVFEPKAVVYSAARQVAERHGLPPDWLNDAVKGLVPPHDADARPVLDVPGLRVAVASPRFLLAMKVAAARVDRDGGDIVFLARLCEADTAEKVLDLVETVWRGTPLPAKSQFLVESLFPRPS